MTGAEWDDERRLPRLRLRAAAAAPAAVADAAPIHLTDDGVEAATRDLLVAWLDDQDSTT